MLAKDVIVRKRWYARITSSTISPEDNPSIRSPQFHKSQEVSVCHSERRCLSTNLRAHELLNEPDANAVSLGAFDLELRVARRANFVLGQPGSGKALCGVRDVTAFVPFCDVELHHLHPDFDGLLLVWT